MANDEQPQDQKESQISQWLTVESGKRVLKWYLAGWAVYGVGVSLIFVAVFGWKNAGPWGDMFGAFNALFTGPSLIGVILALFLQREQIAMQSEELCMQREELKLQREEMKRMANVQEKQLEHLEERAASEAEARITRLCILTERIARVGRIIQNDPNKFYAVVMWSEDEENQLIDLATSANKNAAQSAAEAVKVLRALRIDHRVANTEGTRTLTTDDRTYYQQKYGIALDHLGSLEVYLREEGGYMKFTWED